MIATFSHRRSAWAMTWVEKITVVPFSARSRRQPLELALVDRVEPGERLVEDHQARLVDEGAEQLDCLRHAFRELADLPLGGEAEAVIFEQLAPAFAADLQRQPAQRAEEGDRLEGFHRRIEPALLGQVADQPGDVLRPLVPEHAARALVGVDDAQQHAQHRRLARAVGAEHAVDRALGHFEVDPGDRERAVESLDQPARLDGERTGSVAGDRGLA